MPSVCLVRAHCVREVSESTSERVKRECLSEREGMCEGQEWESKWSLIRERHKCDEKRERESHLNIGRRHVVLVVGTDEKGSDVAGGSVAEVHVEVVHLPRVPEELSHAKLGSHGAALVCHVAAQAAGLAPVHTCTLGIATRGIHSTST